MIYFLEDDDSIRKLVIYGLESQGFEAEGFSLPSKFWRAMEQQPAELVLLDIMLPEEDGLQILKKLRAAPETRRRGCRSRAFFLRHGQTRSLPRDRLRS